MSTDPYQEEELEGRGLDRLLLGWMLTYARPERRALAGCVLLLAGLASLELTQPYLIKTAIDRVLAPGAGSRDPLLLARLWPLAGLYLASVIGLALLQYLQALWLGRTGQRIIAAIRQDVFDHVQRLSLSYFDRQRVPFFTVLVALPILSILRQMFLGELQLDGDLWFQIALIVAAGTGFFIRSRRGDTVLALVMLALIVVYLGVEYPNVSVEKSFELP